MSIYADEYFNGRNEREKRLDCAYKCAICGEEFVSHFNVHEGHRLALYGDVWCCNDCWDGNWDGFVCDEKLLQILKSKNLPVPKRNEKGWLPRG